MADTPTVIFQICSAEEPLGICYFKGYSHNTTQHTQKKKYYNKFRNIASTSIMAKEPAF